LVIINVSYSVIKDTINKSTNEVSFMQKLINFTVPIMNYMSVPLFHKNPSLTTACSSVVSIMSCYTPPEMTKFKKKLKIASQILVVTFKKIKYLLPLARGCHCHFIIDDL
jgi:hypothetical protein